MILKNIKLNNLSRVVKDLKNIFKLAPLETTFNPDIFLFIKTDEKKTEKERERERYIQSNLVTAIGRKFIFRV